MTDKVKMWKALKAMKGKAGSGTIGNGLLQQPLLSTRTSLGDLIGPDSFSTLENLGGLDFIEQHPKNWEKEPSFLRMKSVIRSLPVVNDPAERALGLVTQFYGLKTTPCSVEKKQELFRIIHSHRLEQKKHATSSERCTKAVLSKLY